MENLLYPNTESLKPPKDARFNEPLSEELEADWHRLVEAVQTSEVPPETVFVPLWSDPEVPQAFRDRAMLYLIGTDASLRNDKTMPASLWGYGFVSFEPFNKLGQAPDFDEALFGAWLTDLVDFEQTSGKRVISAHYRIDWALRLFDKGLVAESLVDQTVEDYDITKLLGYKPSYFTRGKFDSDDLSYLPDMRFGILHDLISSNFGPVWRGPQYLWAVNKLHQWTAAQTDSTVELPAWLLEAGKTGRCEGDLYKQMCKEIGMKDAAVAWADIKPGIERYGWSLLKDRMNRTPEFMLDNIDDAEDKVGFVHYALQAKAASRLLGEYHGGVMFEEAFLRKAIDVVPVEDVETQTTLAAELGTVLQAEAARKKRSRVWNAEQKQREQERAVVAAQLAARREAAVQNIGSLMSKLRG